MLAVQCEKCGKDFSTYPCNIRGGKGRFCSRVCAYTSGCNVKHGQSGSRLYVVWSDMKGRCSNPNGIAWPYYGGRGIKVCDEWNESFETFRDWANANGYAEGLELDRIDNNGDYCPSNCRWATRVQQMRNQGKRRDAKTSKFKGVSWCANASKWRTQLHRFGKPVHIGLFKTETEAAIAYDKAAKSLYGEFANLNFKEGGVPS